MREEGGRTKEWWLPAYGLVAGVAPGGSIAGQECLLQGGGAAGGSGCLMGGGAAGGLYRRRGSGGFGWLGAPRRRADIGGGG